MDHTPPRKQWADKPMELLVTPEFRSGKTDMYTSGATQMALIHNTIIRGYNSMVLQARHIAPTDREDFIGYCQTWHRFLKMHLEDEETNLFMKVEEALGDGQAFLQTRQEHAGFMSGLDQFGTYLSDLSSPSAFSGPELIRILEAVGGPLEHHLHSEVAIISNLLNHPSAPAEGTPQHKAIKNAIQGWSRSAVSKGGVWDVVPFVLLNHDKSVENGKWSDWPALPMATKWTSINVTSSWNGSFWLFASCDYDGLPQELHALKV